MSLPTLERLSAPGEHLRDRSGQRGTSWLISGTSVRVISDGTSWRLTARQATDMDTDRWLRKEKLANQKFPTRKDALKAYQAAAALDAPPPSRLSDLGPLRPVETGKYLIADVLIEKTTSTNWRITYPDGSRANARTLAACQRIICDPRNRQKATINRPAVPEHLAPYTEDPTIKRLTARARRGGRVGEACQIALDYLRSSS